MADFLYLPAHKNIAMGGSASATVDADYQAAWLNDGRLGRPARGTSGTFLATITNASSGNVNFVAISHHNLTSAVTLGGSLSGTISAAAVQPDGIPLNTFVSISLASGVGGFTLSGTTSAAAWVVGEVMAGEATSLTLPHYSSDEMAYVDYSRMPELDLSSHYGYDSGLGVRRIWSFGWPVLTQSQVDGLVAAFRAQRNKTRPTAVVRLTSVNDVITGFITELNHNGAEVPGSYEVSMTFEEIPTVRWIS